MHKGAEKSSSSWERRWCQRGCFLFFKIRTIVACLCVDKNNSVKRDKMRIESEDVTQRSKGFEDVWGHGFDTQLERWLYWRHNVSSINYEISQENPRLAFIITHILLAHKFCQFSPHVFPKCLSIPYPPAGGVLIIWHPDFGSGLPVFLLAALLFAHPFPHDLADVFERCKSEPLVPLLNIFIPSLTGWNFDYIGSIPKAFRLFPHLCIQFLLLTLILQPFAIIQ